MGLAVDVGSTTIKCTVVRSAVALTPVAVRAVPTPAFSDTGCLNAAAVLKGVDELIDGVITDVVIPHGNRIAFVAFTSFVMNLVGVNVDDTPVTPVLTVEYTPMHMFLLWLLPIRLQWCRCPRLFRLVA